MLELTIELGWHDVTQVSDTFTANDLELYLDVVNEDISTLEDFNSETPTNEDSTKAISTDLDLLNQILERQYYYNNIGVQIRFVIKQFKKCLEINHLIKEKVEHTRTSI